MRAFTGILAASWSLVGSQDLKQERVLVITRHGIRVPYPPLADLPWDAYSLDSHRNFFTDFADWGADQVAGLTDHGQNVIREMGAHFRQTLLSGVTGGFTIYSAVDSTKRDIKTAIKFFEGAFPEANVTEKDLFGPRTADEEEYVKVLLNQGDVDIGTACPGSAHFQSLLAGEIGGDFRALSWEQQGNIMRMNEFFDCCKPSLCEKQGNSSFGDRCTLMSLPTKWEGQKFYWEDFTGPLSVAAKLTEYVQLLYLNGMNYTQVVPDMSEQQLSSLMRLHEESMAIADEYWNSRNAASELFVHLAATMQQAISGDSIHGLHSKPSDSMVYYAAHDINIYLIRRFLRLNWLTTSFNPNQSPPGGMLIFVLYSAVNGAQKDFYVKAFFMSQSMRQQRQASPLSAADPASRVFAVIPGCADGPELSCPFEDFKRLVLSEIKPECVRLVDPNVLAATTATTTTTAAASADPHSGGWWLYALIGVLCLIGGLGLGVVLGWKCCWGGVRVSSVANTGLGASLQPDVA